MYLSSLSKIYLSSFIPESLAFALLLYCYNSFLTYDKIKEWLLYD